MAASRNPTEGRATFVSHLECSSTGERYRPDTVHGLSDAGTPLLVRYDLDALRDSLELSTLAARPAGMWRYLEFLPIRDEQNIVSLGEEMTPLVDLSHTAADLGVDEVLVKDEGRLPTGSFKARGMAVAVSMAKELGVRRIAVASNGNAGAALAAYGSRAGMETYVFCPTDTPEVNVREIAFHGAKVWRVDGFITDCARIVAEGTDEVGWLDVSTLKEPYRIEGKKTMGLELADQLDWEMPDVIFYPTGGGTGLIGMWKAFNELEQIGWLTRKPRMVAVQAAGCAPIVKAYEEGSDHAQPWEDPRTVAAGIRVPAAIGDFLMLRAVRESDGFALSVTDEAIESAQRDAARDDGLLLCPEGAATLAAYRLALGDGRVNRTDRVVLFNCGSGLKYPMPPAERSLDRGVPIDWEGVAGTPPHPNDSDAPQSDSLGSPR